MALAGVRAIKLKGAPCVFSSRTASFEPKILILTSRPRLRPTAKSGILKDALPRTLARLELYQHNVANPHRF